MRLTAARLKEQALLKKRKQEIADAEELLETRHAMKTYSLDDLGQGGARGRGGPSQAKKRRIEVLTRLAHIGHGVSPEQKNDFSWWKAAWDEHMLAHHGDAWAGVFAGWVQQILNDCDAGTKNAFSLFVHAEARRCFDGVLASRVP